MKDIFSNQDFLEECLINGTRQKCIISSLEDSLTFSSSGLENGVNFTLDLKIPVYPIPHVNDRVIFKNKQYKIDRIEADSALASIKLFLIDLSKGIGR